MITPGSTARGSRVVYRTTNNGPFPGVLLGWNKTSAIIHFDVVIDKLDHLASLRHLTWEGDTDDDSDAA